MKLIPINCPNCTGVLNINTSETAIKCPFCDTTFLIEDGINTYINRMIYAGNTFIKIKDYHLAKEVFEKLTDEYPFDYHGWWGLIKVKTENFTGYMNHISEWNSIYKTYEKVCALTNNADDLTEISKTFDEYEKCWKDHYAQLITNRENELQAIKKYYESLISKANIEVNAIDQKLKEKADEYNKKETMVLIIDFAVVFCITIILSIIEKTTIGGTILIFFILGIISFYISGFIIQEIKDDVDVYTNNLQQNKQSYIRQIPLINEVCDKKVKKIKEEYCMLNDIDS